MDLITSKEIAKKWNISPKRVIVLAKENRIEGAMLIGNTWMIPSDAKKPKDKRFKEQDTNRNVTPGFPFFIYNYKKGESLQLTPEEKRFLDAEIEYHTLNMYRAYDSFKDIFKSSSNPTIHIGSLYYLCFLSLLNNDFEDFNHFYNLFVCEISKYVNQQPIMNLYKLDIDAFFIGEKFNKERMDELPFSFFCDETSSYLFHLQFYYNIILLILKDGNKNLSIYESICSSVDAKQTPYSSICLHLYLGLMYKILKNKEKMMEHLKMSVKMSFESGLVSILTQVAHYYGTLLLEVLVDFPDSFKTTIIENNKKFLASMKNVAKWSKKKPNKMPLLNISDFQFIGYLNNDMSYKEIASLLGVSLSTVSQKYQSIFEKLGVKTKKDFYLKFAEALANPYSMIE